MGGSYTLAADEELDRNLIVLGGGLSQITSTYTVVPSQGDSSTAATDRPSSRTSNPSTDSPASEGSRRCSSAEESLSIRAPGKVLVTFA